MDMDTLTESLAVLSSRGLRAAIESAASTSSEMKRILNTAVTRQLEEQWERQRLRAQQLEEPPRRVAPHEIENNSATPLTPLYAVLFDDEDSLTTPHPLIQHADDSSSTVSQANRQGVHDPAGARPRARSCRDHCLENGGDLSHFAAEPRINRRWRSGFIFFCRHDSFRETFEKMVFGLARHKLDLISHVEVGSTALFLFDQTFRYLHGVFDAASAPGLDIDPTYLRGTARQAAAAAGPGSPFPAQVRFARLHDFPPLEETKLCHLVSYNAGTNVFRHRLAQKETLALLHLLAHPDEAPGDNQLPYESNGYRRLPENPRFREQRRAAYGAKFA